MKKLIILFLFFTAISFAQYSQGTNLTIYSSDALFTDAGTTVSLTTATDTLKPTQFRMIAAGTADFRGSKMYFGDSLQYVQDSLANKYTKSDTRNVIKDSLLAIRDTAALRYTKVETRIVIKDSLAAIRDTSALRYTKVETRLVIKDSLAAIRDTAALRYTKIETDNRLALKAALAAPTFTGRMGADSIVADSVHGRVVSATDSIVVGVTKLTVPDYVFEDSYKQNSIEEMREFYEKNKHLPTIPSGKDITANPVNVMNFSMRLLETLEVQAKYISELEMRLSELENK